jgi:ferredoxin
MAKIVYVDQDECIACETCVELVPAVFAMDPGSGKSTVIDPQGASEAEIQEAVDSCPVECIHWREE